MVADRKKCIFSNESAATYSFQNILQNLWQSKVSGNEVIDLPSSSQYLLKKWPFLATAAKHFLIPKLAFFFVSELLSWLCVCICARANTCTCLCSTELEKEEGRSIKKKCELWKIFQNCYSWISLSTYVGFLDGSVVKNPPAMWEMWVWSLGQEDPLEKEVVTHSSILDWKIPWTEELGRLQSKGCKELAMPEPSTSTCMDLNSLPSIGLTKKFIHVFLLLPVLLEWDLMQWIGKTNVFKWSFIALYLHLCSRYWNSNYVPDTVLSMGQ